MNSADTRCEVIEKALVNAHRDPNRTRLKRGHSLTRVPHVRWKDIKRRPALPWDGGGNLSQRNSWVKIKHALQEGRSNLKRIRDNIRRMSAKKKPVI